MVKIVFAYPDYENLGVEILMACCSGAGHEVSFLFYEVEDAYTGVNFAPDFEGLAKEIAGSECQILALSTVTDNFKHQLTLAKAVKRIAPLIKTIFGGVHITAVPQRVLENDAVDCVAMGEGEAALISLLNGSSRTNWFKFPDSPIRGLVWKSDKGIVGEFIAASNSENLDRLPFANKLPLYTVKPNFSKEYYIMSSRGCPYECSFCFNSSMLAEGPPVRRRTVDNVINELLFALRHYDPKSVLFLDDTFTASKKWLIPFLSRYKKEIAIPFASITHPNLLDEERIKAMADAGCINVQVGIQSLSEDLCRGILRRKGTPERAAEAILLLKKYGISVQVDHMLGVPGDSLENQEQAIRFYNANRPNTISVFWLTYFPGTAIIEEASKLNLLEPHEVETLKMGNRLSSNSYVLGGDCKDWKTYLGVSVVLSWLPFLPPFLVKWLIDTKRYRYLLIRNFIFSTGLPRAIRSLTDRRDFRGRSHLRRSLSRMAQKLLQGNAGTGKNRYQLIKAHQHKN